MRDLFRISDAVEKAREATRSNRITPLFGRPRPRRVVQSDVPKQLIFIEQQVAEAGFAKPHGIFQYRLEYRFQFTG